MLHHAAIPRPGEVSLPRRNLFDEPETAPEAAPVDQEKVTAGGSRPSCWDWKITADLSKASTHFDPLCMTRECFA